MFVFCIEFPITDVSGGHTLAFYVAHMDSCVHMQ